MPKQSLIYNHNLREANFREVWIIYPIKLHLYYHNRDCLYKKTIAYRPTVVESHHYGAKQKIFYASKRQLRRFHRNAQFWEKNRARVKNIISVF